jgi:formamidopyrimidine-DNA glycosylase
MWCETSGVGRSRLPGPTLGIHLGMSGKIVIADIDGSEIDGGPVVPRLLCQFDHRANVLRDGTILSGRLWFREPQVIGTAPVELSNRAQDLFCEPK